MPTNQQAKKFWKTEEERMRLVRKQLAWMLHAHECLKYEENKKSVKKECSMPSSCKVMKEVLVHVRTCTFFTDCSFELCVSTRAILYHWIACIHSDCILCSPQRKATALENTKNFECAASRDFVSHFKTCGKDVFQCDYCQKIKTFQKIQDFRRMVFRKPTQKRQETMLVHSCHCTDPKCKIPQCLKMKRVLTHTKLCNRKVHSSSVCQEVAVFCSHHAIVCTEDDCLLVRGILE